MIKNKSKNEINFSNYLNFIKITIKERLLHLVKKYHKVNLENFNKKTMMELKKHIFYLHYPEQKILDDIIILFLRKIPEKLSKNRKYKIIIEKNKKYFLLKEMKK